MSRMSLDPGSKVAGYVIERLIGVGGMGSVYLAHHPHLPRFDALKLLNPEFSMDQGFAKRFLREAEIVSRLSHPHILPIHDRGSDNGQLWISMPYVEGRDAEEAVNSYSNGMPAELAVHIIEHVGSALDYAHRQHLLHRDIKPANILLAPPVELDGPEWVFLTDFGIAKSIDEATALTATGSVIATFVYASPEQIEGKQLDHRSDIYSLGGVLHRLLTGSLPYPATSIAAVMYGHLHLPQPRPSTILPNLPPGFDEIVAVAMAKDAAERYQSCRELASAAKAALNSAKSTRRDDRRFGEVIGDPAQLSSRIVGDSDSELDERSDAKSHRVSDVDEKVNTSIGLDSSLLARAETVLEAPEAASTSDPASDTIIETPGPGNVAAVNRETVIENSGQPTFQNISGLTGEAEKQESPNALPGRRQNVKVSRSRRRRKSLMITLGILMLSGLSAGLFFELRGAGTVAAGTPGTVRAWGDVASALGSKYGFNTKEPVPVPDLNGVVTIAGGFATGYALLQDGTVRAWGSGRYGQLGNGTNSDGQPGSYPEVPVTVSNLAGVTAIAAGSFTGYALLEDGTVKAWGYGQNGELGNGSTVDSAVPVPVSGLTGVTAIAAGSQTGYALLKDGTVKSWGAGPLGNGGTARSAVPVPVSGLTGVTAIAGGGGGYALLQDGTVSAWGDLTDVPVPVSDLNGVTAIAAGSSTGYALLADGTVRAWGSGALGNCDFLPSDVPVPVSGLTGVTSIAAGDYTGYALLGDGTVRAWGAGKEGQLGNGETDDSDCPVPVSDLIGVTAIAGGGSQGYAVY